MTLLSKIDILCARDLQTQDVDVPEWGGSVRVRSLTGRERDAFEASMVRGEGKDRKVDLTNMRARLVGLTVIDEVGLRLFKDEEVDLLGAKSGAALDRVFAVAQHLNGLSGADGEELTKKTPAAPERRFYFRLALALGFQHPDALLERLSSQQIAELMAFASLEGLPDMRADFGFGQVCATLANIHRRDG